MTPIPETVPPIEVRMAEIVFPNHTNHLGTLFGGQALAWMDKAERNEILRHNAASLRLDYGLDIAQISASLAKDPDLSAVKIDVDTANGRVTLKGPAPSAVARERAEGIAKAVNGVSSVNNQLVVSAS